MSPTEKSSAWKSSASLLFAGLTGFFPTGAAVADDGQELQRLRVEVQELRSRERDLQDRLLRLESKFNGLPAKAAPAVSQVEGASPLDKALAAAQAGKGEAVTRKNIASTTVGSTQLRLADLSVSTVGAAGWSSANDEELETLQSGGHDPKRRGFTLQQTELSIGAAVDPYFTSEAHFVFLEGEGVETEEAFFTTTRLPGEVEIEGGYSLTEFGLLNPTHAHAWDWIDSPVISTRILGPEGMRAPGLRVSKILPLPWFSELHLGMQQASGEFMGSFLGGELTHSHEEESAAAHEHMLVSRLGKEEHDHEEGEEHEEHTDELEATEEEHADEEHDHEEEVDVAFDGIGGRPVVTNSVDGLDDFVYLARLDNFFDVTESTGVKFGLSGLYGANTTGSDGYTGIYGADLLVKWVPADNFRGYPFLKWQSEFIGREFHADEFGDQLDAVYLPQETLGDYGFYSQLLYGFTPGWAVGARVDYAAGSGESVDGRENDPFRSDRLRLSPLLQWRPTEFSRLRLQYNYDQADYLLEDEKHSVWFGFDMLMGTHPAHKYSQN